MLAILFLLKPMDVTEDGPPRECFRV